jgi:ADP-heptose:LPS heptosyltransferase
MINRLILNVLVCIFKFLAHIQGRGPGRRPLPVNIRRLLLVNTTSLGDTLLATPAVNAARRAWPEAEIWALVHQRWAVILESSPYLNGIIEYAGKFKKIYALLKKLHGLNPDLVIILQGNDPDIVPLMYLSRTNYLVCRASTRFPFLLDLPVSLDSRRPVTERLIDLVRAVAGPLDSSGLELFLPVDVTRRASDYWREHGVTEKETLIALNPGGSRQAKRWPEEHWRSLLEKLHQLDDVRLVLMGSAEEKALMERLTPGLAKSRVLIVAGAAIMTSAALLTRAAVLVGPDSGLIHVAVSLGVPVVVLFGPDNPALTGPRLTRAPARVLIKDKSLCPDIAGCRKKNCQGNPCLTAIQPDEVFSALSDVLRSSLAQKCGME